MKPSARLFARLFSRTAASSVAAVVMFWLVRFAVWCDSLTVVRTPLYWALGHGVAWIFAVVIGLYTFMIQGGE